MAGLIDPAVRPSSPFVATAAAEESEPSTGSARPMPKSEYQEWNGKSGLPDSDPRLRQLVADIAELDEDVEVRVAAQAALDAQTDEAVMEFLTTGEPEARARAKARKQETARHNRAAIEKMAGTGGPIFNAEVDRVLAGSDYDRAAFLDYGADIAKSRDEANAKAERERMDLLCSRVQMLAGSGGPEVKKAAQAALDAGTDEAIVDFLKNGYLPAAERDAKAFEGTLKQQRERDKAAEELSELAKKAARASEARKNLLSAHGKGVRALQRAANAMVSAANEARKAAQILAANSAGGHHNGSFSEVKREVARQLEYVRQAADDAHKAAVTADGEAKVLVETGLTYGADWARIARGMADAAKAAVGAAETAQHAIEATEATDKAQEGQQKAEAHAEQARRWREQAEQHARSAEAIAKAAQEQATAARNAANHAKQARQEAEAAERRAWDAAERTRQARLTAEAEQRKAAEARQRAERERANAAAARQRAQQQAAIAARARANAEYQGRIAANARTGAEERERIAKDALGKARDEESNAATARQRAWDAEQRRQAAVARAEAMAATAAQARGTAHEAQAWDAARQARADANTATNAAQQAGHAAQVASGAAANARAAATEATRAAARARAAAREAEAAAARANAAANKAEAEAATTHAEAVQANAKAAEATAAEAKAAEHARNAANLARQAADEAMRALWSARRTKAEAEAAANEAVSAATQAGIAVRASLAARTSSHGIAEPANTAINVVAPFEGKDLDADFAAEVAEQAKSVGDEQAKAAQQRADEAIEAAQKAQEAADRAAAEVKPAFDAAAKASQSAAAAAKAAAEAQRAAADAAIEGAKAREAAARANQADAQAQEDARKAREAANAAARDAAIAGKSADAAEREAATARSAASAAERDAAAARAAAAKAEQDAAAARAAADKAQKHAEEASQAAENARQHAAEAIKSAERAEAAAREEERKRREEAAKQISTGGTPGLTPDEERVLLAAGGQELLDRYRQGLGAANKSVVDFLKDVGAEIFLEITGINDLGRCFGEGNVESCLWTIVNAASLVAIIAKAPAIAGAIGKVAGNIGKFLEGTTAGRKTLEAIHGLKGCKCFPAGTAVETADGTKPIEQIKVGDTVWARDITSGVSRLRHVTALFSREATKLVTITVGDLTVDTTPEHPFWVVGYGWVEAGELKVGDRLQSRDGAQPVISSLSTRDERTSVYNFEVEGDHNYYVSDFELLVHNCDAIIVALRKAVDSVKPLGEAYRGTIIPKTFELTTKNGKKIYFPESGTKHMEEWVTAIKPRNRKDFHDMIDRIPLHTAREVVSEAVEKGIEYEKKVFVQNCEIMFGKPSNSAHSPYVYHFLCKW
ncbi:polymorphic toxin-type HINT domain-containing protein [Longimycelium tulufanense]|uniref:polymorphic toxin-type HINT domain-containing protein n=1 Tax=Longimycelium tulufanense TaxID=907463 RepID=UPI001E3F37E6|nr:polymorphic toxin-type HINT domain-containing protein [Longimycelium tulufanense]